MGGYTSGTGNRANCKKVASLLCDTTWVLGIAL